MVITNTTPTDILEKELKELEAKWNENLKSKDHAGGNSNDNLRMAYIRAILRDRDES